MNEKIFTLKYRLREFKICVNGRWNHGFICGFDKQRDNNLVLAIKTSNTFNNSDKPNKVYYHICSIEYKVTSFFSVDIKNFPSSHIRNMISI